MSDVDGSSRWPEAFAWASRARDAGSGLVDQVRNAEITLGQAFERADRDSLAGLVFAVKVFEVVPGVGKVRARRSMKSIGLSEDVSLADVGPEQRTQIIDEFALLS